MEGDDGDSSSMENIDGGVVLVVSGRRQGLCAIFFDAMK
jgi:hypothetical protein